MFEYTRFGEYGLRIRLIDPQEIQKEKGFHHFETRKGIFCTMVEAIFDDGSKKAQALWIKRHKRD